MSFDRQFDVAARVETRFLSIYVTPAFRPTSAPLFPARAFQIQRAQSLARALCFLRLAFALLLSVTS